MSEKQVIEEELRVDQPDEQAVLFGVNNSFLKLIEEDLSVLIRPFGNEIKIKGSKAEVALAKAVLSELLSLIESGVTIAESDVLSALTMAHNETLAYFQDLYTETLIKDNHGRPVRAKNLGQRKYVQAIRKNDLVFGIGPAGTGKTYLAVVMAVAALKKKQVERLVLTRPAVEAGESLGFLPGDLKEKVDPYLRPIYDALYAILGAEHTERLIERGVIEIAPLAYMRGRTLENAFVILDEAQNTTRAQMKMFLTRLGFGSQMVVNGDVSQIDLPKGHQQSGLVDARKVLQGLPRINFIEFSATEVVRHPVVSEIITAYEKTGNQVLH
ncbi:phosphate starvation protein PhoH [Ligilactobacillus salitolerans]|uniref:PhoH-like protein n=1 Tax=Ligilactobacillus salitolerans TaxID=1808352 RepID=A0A401IU27_9LACO|nr:PhoH family protein [Ligilactobacillus salitolerans]GBG95015.1 phosphate starvation protein PhoH [Ligilactobacillus salitolerans]